MRTVHILRNHIYILCLVFCASFLVSTPAHAIYDASFIPAASSGVPSRVIIPSIGLNNPTESVGIAKNGQMAVPDGMSNHIGWYRFGVVPGRPGTAVFDAHVFAAFSHLKEVEAGDDIYILMDDNRTLHYIVGSVKTYFLKDLKSSMLFAPSVTSDINLITCAGALTKDRTTYDRRLVVSATLIQDALARTL